MKQFMRTKKALAFLLALQILICIFAVSAYATDERIITFAVDGNLTTEITCTVIDEEYEPVDPSPEGTYCVSANAGGAIISIFSYDLEDWTFTGITINGTDCATLPDGNYSDDYGYVYGKYDGFYVYNLTETYFDLYEENVVYACAIVQDPNGEDLNGQIREEGWSIVAHFSPKGSYTYTADINSEFAKSEFVGTDDDGDHWKLSVTSFPTGSEFDHWTWETNVEGADTTAWNATANPMEVVLSEATGNTTFTPIFRQFGITLLDNLKFNELYSLDEVDGGMVVLEAGKIGNGEARISSNVIAGAKARCAIPFSIPNAISADDQAVFRVKIYAGNTLEQTSLVDDRSFSAETLTAGTHSFHTIVDALDATVTQLTVAADFQTKDGVRDTVTKTYSMPTVFLSSQNSNALNYVQSGGFIYKAVASVDSLTGNMKLLAVCDQTINSGSSGGSTDNTMYLLSADGTSIQKINAPSGLKQVKDLTVSADGTIWAYITSTEGAGSNGTAGYLAKYCDSAWELLSDSKLMTQQGNRYVAVDVGHIIAVGTNVIAYDKTWNGSEWITGGHGKTGVAQMDGVYYGSDAQGIYRFDPENGWELILSGNYAYEITDAAAGKLIIDRHSSAKEIVLIDVNTGTAESISTSIFNGRETVGSPVGIDKDGNPCFFFLGYQLYNETQFGGNAVSVFCKYVNGQWVNMNEAAFWADTEDPEQYVTKTRPAAINTSMNPVPGITVYGAEFGAGHSGSLYIEFGDSTITFDPGEGTLDNAALATLTAPILSAIDASKVPGATRNNYVFGGWYYDQACTVEFDAGGTAMPAKDITLYAKWTERDGLSDELAFYRERALNALAQQLGKYSETDYSEANWAALQKAYTDGVAAINAAKAGTEKVDGNIEAALNEAAEAMRAVPKLDKPRKNYITVAVSMDANTLGLGYLIEPTLVTVEEGTPASKVITDLLAQTAREKYGVTAAGYTTYHESEPTEQYPWMMTGSVDSDFYLSQVYYPEQQGYKLPAFIENAIGGIPFDESDANGNYLGEFDYLTTSGWTYSIGDRTGGSAQFPGVGASGWTLSDGEVMRWQFTLMGYGSDLNADNTQWGAQSMIPTLGDKSALTWRMAEINAAGEQSQYGDAYDDAIAVLTDAEATQREVDAALAALSGSGTGSGSGTTDENKDKDENPTVFEDVPADAYYAEAVAWAVENGITDGMTETEFKPESTCNRGQIVTFLWRAAGSPKPTSTNNPFEDVKETDYFYEAVLWAVANGVTDGVDATHFAPGRPCTREQAVTFLWRAAGSEQVSGAAPFADVDASDYSAAAVAWAVANEITDGVSETRFAPENECTRGQIVTFLYREYGGQ